MVASSDGSPGEGTDQEFVLLAGEGVPLPPPLLHPAIAPWGPMPGETLALEPGGRGERRAAGGEKGGGLRVAWAVDAVSEDGGFGGTGGEGWEVGRGGRNLGCVLCGPCRHQDGKGTYVSTLGIRNLDLSLRLI